MSKTDLPVIGTIPARDGYPSTTVVGKPVRSAKVDPSTPVVSGGRLVPPPAEVTR